MKKKKQTEEIPEHILNKRIKITDIIYRKPKYPSGYSVDGVFVRQDYGQDECFDDLVSSKKEHLNGNKLN